MGKVMALQSLIGVLLLIQFVSTFLLSFILDGGISISVFFTYFLEYLGAFLILGLVNLSGALLSLLLSSTGLAVFVSYLLYVAMGIVGIYLPQLRVISISRILGNYDNLITNFNLSLLLSVVSYYIILFIVGNLVFEKKEESVCQYE